MAIALIRKPPTQNISLLIGGFTFVLKHHVLENQPLISSLLGKRSWVAPQRPSQQAAATEEHKESLSPICILRDFFSQSNFL